MPSGQSHSWGDQEEEKKEEEEEEDACLYQVEERGRQQWDKESTISLDSCCLQVGATKSLPDTYVI